MTLVFVGARSALAGNDQLYLRIKHQSHVVPVTLYRLWWFDIGKVEKQ